MNIYQLTPIGHKLARSVSNPDVSAFRIIAFLDQTGHSTTEQIAEYCGTSVGATSAILGQLRRKRIVSEVSGTTV